MKKKKWYCSPLTKGILLVLQYVFLGTAIFSGLFFLALEIQGGLRLSDNTGNYFDSSSFTNTFYNNTWDIMHGCFRSSWHIREQVRNQMKLQIFLH